ncbi:MAG: carbohydrate kinase family protein, partial [Candidatus Thorarchaeota archaeon]
ILGGSPHFEKPDYMIFGASTYSTVFECVKYHSSDDIASCKLPTRFPGGPTAELATTLSSQGFKVSFVSSVGDDQDGWNLISDLIQQNIDVTDIVVADEKHTNETIIVDYATRKQTLIGIDEMFALSITSPSQVPWDKLANAKAIYIGEVFVEVALAISAYAKSRQIPVIYRCSVPFLEMGISKLESLLNQVDVLILSNQAWRFLEQDKEKEILSEISSMTDATIIVRIQTDSYQIIQSKTKPILKKIKANTDDISPWFSLGLLNGIVEGSNIESAVDLGIQMEAEKHKSS